MIFTKKENKTTKVFKQIVVINPMDLLEIDYCVDPFVNDLNNRYLQMLIDGHDVVVVRHRHIDEYYHRFQRIRIAM